MKQSECVIITGLSGAGRSSALRALEDLGYFCVDNLPPRLVASVVANCRDEADLLRVAVVIDTRAGIFFDQIYDAIDALKKDHVSCSVLYLETSDETLIRRYKEVRRPHPMHASNVTAGIAQERLLLARIRERASYVIDTANLTIHQLSSLISELYAEQGTRKDLTIFIESFGYKNGIPLDADYVFDMRTMKNPYYAPELRHKNGLCKEVAEFIFSNDFATQYLTRIHDFLTFLLPHFKENGQRQITVAIGCTGGMHRSVAMADKLAATLLSDGCHVIVMHRDIQKGAPQRDGKEA